MDLRDGEIAVCWLADGPSGAISRGERWRVFLGLSLTPAFTAQFNLALEEQR